MHAVPRVRLKPRAQTCNPSILSQTLTLSHHAPLSKSSYDELSHLDYSLSVFPGSAVRHVNHNAVSQLYNPFFLLPSEKAYESCKINLVLKFNKLLPSNCSSLGPSSCYGANVMQCEVLCRVLQLNPFKMWR